MGQDRAILILEHMLAHHARDSSAIFKILPHALAETRLLAEQLKQFILMTLTLKQSYLWYRKYEESRELKCPGLILFQEPLVAEVWLVHVGIHPQLEHHRHHDKWFLQFCFLRSFCLDRCRL